MLDFWALCTLLWPAAPKSCSLLGAVGFLLGVPTFLTNLFVGNIKGIVKIPQYRKIFMGASSQIVSISRSSLVASRLFPRYVFLLQQTQNNLS
jgi:hypothetical protein